MRFIRIYTRKFKANLQYHSIVTIGLGLAITAVIFIFFYVSHELSYNKFTSKRKEIYKVLTYHPNDGISSSLSIDPIAKMVKEKSPFVKEAIRCLPTEGEFEIDNQFTLVNVIYSEPAFFDLFELKINPSALQKFKDTPNGIIITESFAQKYFRAKNPEGKIIRFSTEPLMEKSELMVVGIMKDLPKTSTITGDIIINYAYNDQTREAEDWVYNTESYLYIPQKHDIQSIEENLNTIVRNELKNVGIEARLGDATIKLQRFDKIYLNSKNVIGETKKGNFSLLKILILVGSLILAMSFFNFFTISSGIYFKNLKGLYTRQCFGASHNDMKKEIITESVISIFFSSLLSVLLFFILNPIINKYLNIPSTSAGYIRLTILFSFLLGVGIISGTFQHSFIKRMLKRDSKMLNLKIKRTLTVIQLTVFILIISSMLIVSKQVHFMKNEDLGFDLENTVQFDISGKTELLKELFSNRSYVNSAALGSGIFRLQFGSDKITVDSNQKQVNSILGTADKNYINVYKLKVIEGRNIDSEFQLGNDVGTNSLIEVLVNEEFVKQAGLENPIGTIVHNHIMTGQIVGVLENVYQSAFFEPVKPLIIGNVPGRRTDVILNITKGSFPKFLSDFQKYCESVGLGAYVDMLYTKTDKEQVFRKEDTLVKLFSVSFLIALVILGLGLLAINMLIAESKIKEIGIRKVNGAKISEILALLNKDIVIWIAVAFIVATPISWYVMNKWLQNFAYKTELNWWVFALAGLLALGIALLTVSWQSWSAATRNPVEALRYE